MQDILKEGIKTPMMINATVGSTVRGGYDNLVIEMIDYLFIVCLIF